MALTITTAVVGRRLGLTATHGIADRDGNKALMIDSTGLQQNSTVLTFNRIHLLVSAIVGASATLLNYGLTHLTSGTATAVAFELSAPVEGLLKEIFIGNSSASAFSASGSATTTVFNSSDGAALTKITMIKGSNVVLRGLSTTVWAVLNRTSGVTIA